MEKLIGAVKFVTSRFLKKNEQFAYIRRYKADLRQAVPTFFNSIISNNEFPETDLKVKGNKFYCNDKEAGFAFTLSTAQDLKSSNFNGVKNIIFDEFIIDERSEKILFAK